MKCISNFLTVNCYCCQSQNITLHVSKDPKEGKIEELHVVKASDFKITSTIFDIRLTYLVSYKANIRPTMKVVTKNLFHSQFKPIRNET